MISLHGRQTTRGKEKYTSQQYKKEIRPKKSIRLQRRYGDTGVPGRAQQKSRKWEDEIMEKAMEEDEASQTREESTKLKEEDEQMQEHQEGENRYKQEQEQQNNQFKRQKIYDM